ncbi:MAG: GntR family transcriptional regulator [Phycisphaeraceae bacterium]|nr:GntR family transcriptional regulator [Phycisphaeraceae bacterium]
MSTLLDQLELDPMVLPNQQITRFVRDLIKSGKLEAGSRIPPTSQLARQWRTHVPVVHGAMSQLMKEGLLARRPGKGTYVLAQEEKLSRVAIYMMGEQAGVTGTLATALLAELQKVMREQDIDPDIWFDSRPRAERDTVWPALAQAVQSRQVDAVILPQASPAIVDWIARLNIPYAVYGCSHHPHSVSEDRHLIAELPLRGLKDQGCSSVGLITGMHPDTKPNWQDKVHGSWEFHEHFHTIARQLALEVRPRWVFHPPYPEHVKLVESAEVFGYESFHRLWAQADRPQGLVITDNVMAQGVIKAMLELQVQIPGELKIVSARQSAYELFAPMPISHLVINDAEAARMLMLQIRRQFEGETCKMIHVAPALVMARPRPCGKGIEVGGELVEQST